MSAKIVAIRVEMRRDKAILTTMGQSPRGTKVRIKSVEASGLHGPREEFDRNVAAALEELIPGRVETR